MDLFSVLTLDDKSDGRYEFIRATIKRTASYGMYNGTATKDFYMLEILDLERRGIVLYV